MRRLRFLAFAVAVVAALALPATAAATSVSNVSVSLYRSGVPVADPKAGEGMMYGISFTATNGLANGQDITIVGPAGTSWPSSGYQLNHGTGGGCGTNVAQPSAPTRNGSTVTVHVQNLSAINSPPVSCPSPIAHGEALELLINGGVTNPTTAGNKTLSVATTADSTPVNSPQYTIVPNDPGSLTVSSGGNQHATVGEAFANPLAAHLTDAYGNDISGKTVTFGTPGTGPSGDITAATPTTNASGIATTGTVTANTVGGDWDATASVSGGSNPSTTFALSNDPGPVDSVAVGVAPDTITADGTSTSTATLTAYDQYSNPIAGLSTGDISFMSTDPGHLFGGVTDDGNGSYGATLTASTTPGASTITGTYDDIAIVKSDTAMLTQTADLVAPVATINIGPGAKTKDRTPTFYFSADEDNATFTCKLDSDKYRNCTSPHTTAKLSYGRHKFSVKGKDVVGNNGAADSVSFKVIRP